MKAFNVSAGTEEEMLATLPPSENENDVEDEMVRGRKSSAASENEDQVNLEMNQLVKTQQKRSDNYF